MSNPESRRLERVATAIRMTKEELSGLSEPDLSWEIARAVLKVILRPRAGQPVAWQARAIGSEEDWSQVDYPERHNDPDRFEYRPVYAAPV